MDLQIVDIEALDIRFPTSLTLSGSDAVHKDPDYSTAYAILKTNNEKYTGHGFTFTIGRGTEIVVQAIHALSFMVKGRSLKEITGNFAAFWRHLTNESQLRWLGPEKGVIHLATAAIVNGIWDLWAKVENKPVWKLLADMEPEDLLRTIDFRYVTDVLTPHEALEILHANRSSKLEREKQILKDGVPAYITSVGWLGYSDEKVVQLCKEAVEDGWTSFKMKVGITQEDDLRRGELIRGAIGDDKNLMMDANQVWEVDTAIYWVRLLSILKPLWIEEPISPDDVLGHLRISKALQANKIGVATGEHCQNRVMFKQFLQSGAMQYCQIDACRMGGLNEVLCVLLLAAKFKVPVCPHAGGVGLCELVSHISIFNYIAISPTFDNVMVEYADHLHEHFIHPAKVKRGRYLAPEAPGYSAELKPESIEDYRYPNGSVWKQLIKEGKHKPLY